MPSKFKYAVKQIALEKLDSFNIYPRNIWGIKTGAGCKSPPPPLSPEISTNKGWQKT